MVGLNPFSSKHNSAHPPPPSYKENDPSPLLFAETTVTTTEVVTTTTQTTTHFFSLPLWKKRAAPLPSFSSNATSNRLSDADEMGYRSSMLRIEKDLPPTPGSKRTRYFLPQVLGDFPFGASPRPSPTSALAQASLGISLPHVLPQASASSSSSEINSIAFASTPPKGTQSIRTKRAVSAVAQSAPSDVPNQRRNRGLSLGPAGFLNFGPVDAKGKGKEVEKEVPETVNHTPNKLTRRSSFWSRKKVSGSLPLARRSEANLVPLPALPPFTPFSVDMPKATSSSSNVEAHPLKSNHTRGLSRSHSERARRLQKPPERHALPNLILSAPDSPRPERVRRPKTADAPPSPQFLSNSSSERFSFTSSPLASPTLEKDEDIPDNPPPRRPRAQTNPPLLRRLSMNLFSPSANHHTSPSAPAVHSPLRTSTTKPTPTPVPKPQIDEESPEGYLSRLMVSVSKAEIGGILASSGDSFHVQALRSYIGRFDFADDPLDVALRRLLMDVGLPRETQQIDRVMESFASRYFQLHPGLFSSEDQPYVLAFSLIMLHTDAFNKSNKRKMTKVDYIKNTRMPGVAPEVLDCFYDNIVFAPFIFVEDPVDVNGQRGFSIDGSRALSASSSSGNLSGSIFLSKGAKVDPYYLISNNLLDPLRVDVEMFVPLINPYSYEGTGGAWNEEELQDAFANPNLIELGSLDPARVASTTPFFGAGGSAAGPFAFAGDLNLPGSDETWSLKVTKVGLLNRKDDLLEGGRKASNRKWKTWSVVLTGSQLLFVRDPAWASAFLNQSEGSRENHGYFPQTAMFNPDEVISVKDAVAVYDRSYQKHDNIFRFALADGRQFLFGSSSQSEMNEWISRINYASAFKSTGVRMRSAGMSGRDVQLTGVAAATSHLHDLQHNNQSRTHWDGDASHDLMEMLSGPPIPISPFKKAPPLRRPTAMSTSSEAESDVAVAPEVDGADQFKATFDQVKADLAAGRCASPDGDSPTEETRSSNTRLPSRSRVVVSKIRDLESKISAAQTQLDADIRFVRNVATLTPFQRSTRDRLSLAVQNISKRIMKFRLEIVRCTCHRDVLYNDLDAEGKSWSRAKKMALRAATETLQSHQGPSVPRMTLSFHESNSIASPPVSIPPKTSYTPSAHKSESTAGSFQSFHSAFEFGPLDSDRLGGNSPSNSPKNSSSGSFNHDLSKEEEEEEEIAPLSSRPPVGRVSDVTSHSDDMHHERFYTARESAELEQAEEWNKTRCAQRVSLVRVPSVIGLSARKFERDTSR
ncbi:hypothetical protein BT96DRAFT_961604 [Gymnopus androsaceus JB14]|uniref:SEC7 domain-containing protein n=1 Tax=Gymnopus androsaceus JB14 TaxID=1447944 RepID=A0A6A4INB4_9AGAR|nr:hypothetical protein BT96DRAFT_961604 [Gymnopus androsaceus JB14]